MADKVEETLPEFDPLTPEQEQKVSAFVDKYMQPDHLPASYRWLLEESPTYDSEAAAAGGPTTGSPTAASQGSTTSSKKEKGESSSSKKPVASPSATVPLCRRRIIAYKLLVARKWDLEKAHEMLQHSCEWREKHSLHTRPFFPSPIVINGYDDEALRAFFKMDLRPTNEELDRIIHRLRPHYWCNFHKWDRSGHPIIIEMIGQIDAKNALKSLKELVRPGQPLSHPVGDMHSYQNELANYLIRYQDAKAQRAWVEKHSGTTNTSAAEQKIVADGAAEEEGGGAATAAASDADCSIPPIPTTGPFPRRITSMTAILDASGLSMSMLSSDAVSIIKTTLALDQANYPELLHRCFIVNCPSIVMFAFNIFKGSIDPRVRDKITFCSVEDTKAILLKAIDAENLPKFLGGECECDGGCVCMTARRAGEVAKDDSADFIRTDEEKISAGAKKSCNFVLRRNEKVIWEWQNTCGHNIEFSVEFRPKDAAQYAISIHNRKTYLKGIVAAAAVAAGNTDGDAAAVPELKGDNPNTCADDSMGVTSPLSPLYGDRNVDNGEIISVADATAELANLEVWGSLVAHDGSAVASSGKAPTASFSSPTGGELRPGCESKVVVKAHEKVISHAGEFVATGGDGALTVTWSNHFSRFTGKNLRFRIARLDADNNILSAGAAATPVA